jgi:hypothetical protein
LANVNTLFDKGIEKLSVDVKLTEFEVHGGLNGEKEPETGHANDKGEGLSVVETRALTTSFSDSTGFQERDSTLRVGLDIVGPHAIDDHAVGGEIDKFPRAVVHMGVVLLLHPSVPILCLRIREGSTVRRGLDTVCGGH